MATNAGVNPNTMQRAFAELERSGLVYSERTSGRFVTKDESILKGLHAKLAGRYFDELEEKLIRLGMNREELKAAAKQWLERTGR